MKVSDIKVGDLIYPPQREIRLWMTKAFGFHWVTYRPNHGYPTYRDALEAAKEHVGRQFREHSVEI